MARQKKTNITYRVAESDSLKVLERYVESGDDEFVFYDICICNTVIIKDCRLVSGKNGEFIATPARKAGDNYYPYAYISEAVQEAILRLMAENDWKETDETYLTFDKPDKQEKQEKSASNRRRR